MHTSLLQSIFGCKSTSYIPHWLLQIRKFLENGQHHLLLMIFFLKKRSQTSGHRLKLVRFSWKLDFWSVFRMHETNSLSLLHTYSTTFQCLYFYLLTHFVPILLKNRFILYDVIGWFVHHFNNQFRLNAKWCFVIAEGVNLHQTRTLKKRKPYCNTYCLVG